MFASLPKKIPCDDDASDAAGFAQGLEEQGFVEAQNLAVDYRFANGQRDRLAMLAADLQNQDIAGDGDGAETRTANGTVVFSVRSPF